MPVLSRGPWTPTGSWWHVPGKIGCCPVLDFVRACCHFCRHTPFFAVGFVFLVVAAVDLSHAAKLGRISMDLGSSKSVKREVMNCFRRWCLYGLLTVLVALPQIPLFLSRVGQDSRFLRLLPIWMDFPPDSNPLSMWFRALGFYVPLNILSFIILPYRSAQFAFQVGFFALFLLANVVVFQPWVLDNTKVFYVWVFGSASAVCSVVKEGWDSFHNFLLAQRGSSRTRVPAIIFKASAVFIFLSLILSGLFCCIAETASRSQLYDTIDEEWADFVTLATPHDARIAISTKGRHMRPESALAGRQLLSSYWGWISNHGVPGYVERNSDNNDFLEGIHPRAIPAVFRHNITHFVVDAHAPHHYNVQFLNTVGIRLGSNGRFFLYEVLPREFLLGPPVDCMPQGDATQARCEALGCLWAEGSVGPWCQHQRVEQYRRERGLADSDSVDCGFAGITQQQCFRLGCSFFSGLVGRPQCQHPVSSSHFAPHGRGIPASIRRTRGADCGRDATDEIECLNRGCVWKPSQGAWCTVPQP
mmetsp:Transcript_27618/g.69226  ORF Transcript_27618/g.69226 Transcript_27618/m.69226 type:complete len:530 (-) Transcript_27618:199-1788(-)